MKATLQRLLTEKRKEIGVLVVSCLLVGVFAWTAARTYYVVVPQKRLMEQARIEEDIQRRTYIGEVVSVTPNQITIKVKGNLYRTELGKIKTYTADLYTNVQIGTAFINEPNVVPTLSGWFKPGDLVEAIERKGNPKRLVLLRRNLREGEQPPYYSELPSMSAPYSNY